MIFIITITIVIYIIVIISLKITSSLLDFHFCVILLSQPMCTSPALMEQILLTLRTFAQRRLIPCNITYTRLQRQPAYLINTINALRHSYKKKQTLITSDDTHSIDSSFKKHRTFSLIINHQSYKKEKRFSQP
jgi:hypothetical protein